MIRRTIPESKVLKAATHDEYRLTLRAFLVLVCVLFSGNLLAQDSTIHYLKAKDDIKLLSVLWQQHSAEYRALCFQAFNIASERLSKMKLKKRKHYAIITDIDETILDNSYYEADRIMEGKEFDFKGWKEWTDQSAATPVPGAVEFLHLARKRGVSVFYISNRDSSEINSTILNLKRFDLPDADREHLHFSEGKSSKEDRRQRVLKDYNIIMLLGDNLNDFTSAFEKKEVELRKSATDGAREEWGKRFIVLPNAIYGEWENALYNYRKNLSVEERRLALQNMLKLSRKK